MPFLFEFLHFPCLDSPAKIGERRPLRNRGTAEGFYYCVFLNLFACQITYCCTYGLLCTGRGIAVPRKSLVWRLRTVPTQDKLYQADSSAGAYPFGFRGEIAAAPSRAGKLHSLPSDQCHSCRDKLRHPERMPNAIRTHHLTQHDRDRQNDHGIPAQRNHE